MTLSLILILQSSGYSAHGKTHPVHGPPASGRRWLKRSTTNPAAETAASSPPEQSPTSPHSTGYAKSKWSPATSPNCATPHRSSSNHSPTYKHGDQNKPTRSRNSPAPSTHGHAGAKSIWHRPVWRSAEARVGKER